MGAEGQGGTERWGGGGCQELVSVYPLKYQRLELVQLIILSRDAISVPASTQTPTRLFIHIPTSLVS
jgi:hypothetical protein